LRIEEKDFYITDEVALKLALYLGEGSKFWRDAQLKWDEEFNQ
jgi:plasmid maintenance system antidote protein VapI